MSNCLIKNFFFFFFKSLVAKTNIFILTARLTALKKIYLGEYRLFKLARDAHSWYFK